MQPADAATIADISAKVFGAPIEAPAEGCALAADHGVMLFTRIADGAYNVVLGFEASHTGAYAKDEIREGFRWLFLNTDALVVLGSIDKANAACLAMVPHTLGATIVERAGDYLYRATLGRWASDYGLPQAVGELTANGQTVKAQKLAKAGGIG